MHGEAGPRKQQGGSITARPIRPFRTVNLLSDFGQLSFDNIPANCKRRVMDLGRLTTLNRQTISRFAAERGRTSVRTDHSIITRTENFLRPCGVEYPIHASARMRCRLSL